MTTEAQDGPREEYERKVGKLWIFWNDPPDLGGEYCGCYGGRDITPENQELVAAILAITKEVRDSHGLRTFHKTPRALAVAIAEMILAEDRMAFTREFVGPVTFQRHMDPEP